MKEGKNQLTVVPKDQSVTYLEENVSAQDHLSRIVINKKGVDVVRLAIFHETWPPNFDDVDIGNNQQNGRPDASKHEPVIDPSVTKFPNLIGPQLKLAEV